MLGLATLTESATINIAYGTGYTSTNFAGIITKALTIRGQAGTATATSAALAPLVKTSTAALTVTDAVAAGKTVAVTNLIVTV